MSTAGCALSFSPAPAVIQPTTQPRISQPNDFPTMSQSSASHIYSPLPSIEKIHESKLWSVIDALTEAELSATGLKKDSLPIIAQELKRQSVIDLTNQVNTFKAYLNPSLLQNGPSVFITSVDIDVRRDMQYSDADLRSFVQGGLEEYTRRKGIPWQFVERADEANILMRLSAATASLHSGGEAGNSAIGEVNGISPLIGPYLNISGKDVTIGIAEPRKFQHEFYQSMPQKATMRLVAAITSKTVVHEITHLEGQREHTNWATEYSPSFAPYDGSSDSDVMESSLGVKARTSKDMLILPWTILFMDEGVEYGINFSDGDPLNDPSNLLTRALRAVVIHEGF